MIAEIEKRLRNNFFKVYDSVPIYWRIPGWFEFCRGDEVFEEINGMKCKLLSINDLGGGRVLLECDRGQISIFNTKTVEYEPKKGK